MLRRSIDLAPLADADLQTIATYSARMWGVDQALEYMEALARQIELLVDFPERGVWVGTRYPGIRKVAVRRHVIYYSFDEDLVRIVRILHERLRVSPKMLR